MAELIGYILTINVIIIWSLASLVYKSSLGETNLKGCLLFRLCCVSLTTFLFSLIFGSYLLFSSLKTQEVTDYFIACTLSGISVTIGDLLYFQSLKKIDASRSFPLTQLSLVFVYPFAFIFFGEEITSSILLGGALILSSVFLLGSKDKPEESISNKEIKDKTIEKLFMGIILAIGTAFCWAFSIVSFNQARIIIGDVFLTSFFRIFSATIFIGILGLFQHDYYSSFKKENRSGLKYYFYIGIAGSLSLGLADTLFFIAAELNGLILTSTFTANTPIIQQIFSILIIKEKVRKRFFIAVCLIILGNYIILFI